MKGNVDEEPIKAQVTKVDYPSPRGEGFSVSSDVSVTPPPLPARNHGSCSYSNNNYSPRSRFSAFNKLDYSRSFNVSSKDFVHTTDSSRPVRSVSQTFQPSLNAPPKKGQMWEIFNESFSAESPNEPKENEREIARFSTFPPHRSETDLVSDKNEHHFWVGKKSVSVVQPVVQQTAEQKLHRFDVTPQEQLHQFTAPRDQLVPKNYRIQQERNNVHFQAFYTKKNSKRRSVENVSEEGVYVAIDDDITMTYSSNIGTSQSYTLPEYFDMEEHREASPWYYSSDSQQEEVLLVHPQN